MRKIVEANNANGMAAMLQFVRDGLCDGLSLHQVLKWCEQPQISVLYRMHTEKAGGFDKSQSLIATHLVLSINSMFTLKKTKADFQVDCQKLL